MERWKLLAMIMALMMLAAPVALADDGDDDEAEDHEEDEASDDRSGKRGHKDKSDDLNETEDENETEDDDNESDDDKGRRHGRDNKSDDEDENETDDGGRHKGRNESAIAARIAFKENHTAFVDAFVAALKSFHVSWKENASAIREECRSAELDRDNATKEERHEHAKCIKSGYSEWRAERRAEMKELRAQFRELVDGWKGKGSEA